MVKFAEDVLEHRRMGTLWLGGAEGLICPKFYTDNHKHPPPLGHCPRDVIHPPKIWKTPLLLDIHKHTPLGHCLCDVIIHIPKGLICSFLWPIFSSCFARISPLFARISPTVCPGGGSCPPCHPASYAYVLEYNIIWFKIMYTSIWYLLLLLLLLLLLFFFFDSSSSSPTNAACTYLPIKYSTHLIYDVLAMFSWTWFAIMLLCSDRPVENVASWEVSGSSQRPAVLAFIPYTLHCCWNCLTYSVPKEDYFTAPAQGLEALENRCRL